MRILFPLAALAACSAVPSSAQQDFSKVEIKAETLAPGIAVLFGAGGNIGVSYGDDGTVLIDDQFAPLSDKIMAAVAGLGAKPAKYLINTHWHFDHAGGNEPFGKAGVTIIAHDNVRTRLAAGANVLGNVIPPAPKVALPVITYADGIKLHLNGDVVQTFHTGGGHTDGDSIVVWTNANVIHMGDMFMNKVSLPFIDLNSGGSAVRLLASIDKALTLANDQTKIIPGHGPMATRADLLEWRLMLKTVIGKVQADIKAKKPLEAIKAGKHAAPWEVKGGFISGDAFTEAVYKSLTAAPAAPVPTATAPMKHQHGNEAHAH